MLAGRRLVVAIAIGAGSIVAMHLALAQLSIAAPMPDSRAAGNTRGTGSGFMQIYSVGGNVSGSKLPQLSADLVPPEASAKQRFDVDVAVSAAGDEFGVPNKLFGKLQVTLYAVDESGNEKKLGTKSDRPKKSEGVATVAFSKLRAPGSYFRISAKTIGGSVADLILIYNGSVSLSGGLRSGSSGRRTATIPRNSGNESKKGRR